MNTTGTVDPCARRADLRWATGLMDNPIMGLSPILSVPAVLGVNRGAVLAACGGASNLNLGKGSAICWRVQSRTS